MTWPSIKLKRIATTIAGGTPSVGEPQYWADNDHGHAWVSISDMSNKDVVTATSRRVTDAGVEAARLPIGSPGTLLLSMYASIGHTAFLGCQASWNQAILGIIPSPNWDVRFIRYALDSLRPNLVEHARSNTQANLNAEQVGNLEIPTPALEEQRRIADFLDAETARIDSLARKRLRQSELLNSRFQAWLTTLYNELAERHGHVRLRHISQGLEQGWSPQCDDRRVKPGEWGVVKAGCVNRGVFDPGQNKALPPGLSPRLEYRLKNGDLLVSRASGSPELIGSSAVVEELDSNLLLCDKIYRVRLRQELAEPWYVAFMLRAHPVREHIKNGISGAEGMANNLPSSTVKNCNIPGAPLAEQRTATDQIRIALDSTNRIHSALQQANTLLAERRRSLVTAAVTGQLDVSSASGRGIEEGLS